MLHRCDNPPCTNPEHLFLGTRADNVYDMLQKGRQYFKENTETFPVGEKNPNAKLDEWHVQEIRRLWSEGIRDIPKLGRVFCITNSNIRAIVFRRTWKHI